MGLTSRLIVKNLPKSTTEQELRKFFEEKGRVTDVQLKYTSEGKFRQFGFIGFHSEQEAESAKEYFNRAYFGGSKLIVDTCTALGDSSKPRAWSKHAVETRDGPGKVPRKALDDEDSEPKTKRKRKEEEILEKCKDDPALAEFLEMHMNKSSWGNDSVMKELESQLMQKKKEKVKGARDVADFVDEVVAEDSKEAETVFKPSKDSKKTHHDVNFFTLKLRDLPKKAHKRDIKSFFAPLHLSSIRMPRGIRGIAYVGFKTEESMKQALAKDRGMILGNRISVKKYESKETVQQQARHRQNKWSEQQNQLEQEAETIGESGRIFLRNLPYHTSEEEIRDMFEKFGPLTEVHLPIDRLSRQLKGYGFVSFMLPEQASKAYAELDGSILHGRLLHLLPSKAKEENTEVSEDAGSSFKKTKEIQKKKTAGASHNWNSLFLGQNAVAEIIADRYDVRKDELLLDHGDEKGGKTTSVGVRMALAETEIVSETKDFLESNGVCLDAFNTKGKVERSPRCILAKNLPIKTKSTELKEAFSKHGVISRILMPPYGITAIIEFEEPAEARIAFKKLAYSKFKNLPLYLEWAPVNIFGNREKEAVSRSEKKEPISEPEAPETPLAPPGVKPAVMSREESQDDEDDIPEPDTTLFVKNLNFNTTEEKIKAHFRETGRVYSVKIATKKDPTNPSRLLSMGYGFVQFYKASDTQNALKYQQNTMLENHLLELKMSARTLQAPGAATKTQSNANEGKQIGTKLLVRNVPFQASQEEITDLFKPFGEIKAVRLPLKADGSGDHRGFCFIEYHMALDAKRAFDTLSKSTHLYGRRLVVEWAAAEESVEDLRRKTARKFDAQSRGALEGKRPKAKKMLQDFVDSQATKAAKSDDEEDME